MADRKFDQRIKQNKRMSLDEVQLTGDFSIITMLQKIPSQR
jgi:hypothetical protein